MRSDRSGLEPALEFYSILFDRPEAGSDADGAHEPGCFADLNLDQVLASMTASRGEYDLAPFFYTPMRDVAAVDYRHEVLHDLEQQAVFDIVAGFAQRMQTMRQHLVQAKRLHYRYQQHSLFLDAVDSYCQAVNTLAEELADVDVTSRGFMALREYLADYVAGDAFASLAGETRERKAALASVDYCVHIKGSRVRVSKYEGEADYSAEIEETFAKFKQGAVDSYRFKLPDVLEMNHVEAQVLDIVARLYPDVFLALDDYCARRRDYLDATISRFDREVQFLVAYLEYIERFKSAGLTFCYPDVSARASDVWAGRAFDLALANKLVPGQSAVVCNDFYLSDPERILVVTGPNQGGKTTFARMFGQLHYLASLGYPVPGRQARCPCPTACYPLRGRGGHGDAEGEARG